MSVMPFEMLPLDQRAGVTTPPPSRPPTGRPTAIDRSAVGDAESDNGMSKDIVFYIIVGVACLTMFIAAGVAACMRTQRNGKPVPANMAMKTSAVVSFGFGARVGGAHQLSTSSLQSRISDNTNISMPLNLDPYSSATPQIGPLTTGELKLDPYMAGPGQGPLFQGTTTL